MSISGEGLTFVYQLHAFEAASLVCPYQPGRADAVNPCLAAPSLPVGRALRSSSALLLCAPPLRPGLQHRPCRMCGASGCIEDAKKLSLGGRSPYNCPTPTQGSASSGKVIAAMCGRYEIV